MKRFAKCVAFLLLVALLAILGGCGPDYGVVVTEDVIYQEIIEETYIVGEVGYEWGIAYDQAVDILFIIDESCSMADDQDRLSTYMPDIYNILVGSDFTDLAWRVGVTGAGPNSQLYAKVDYDDLDALQKLLALTSVVDTSGYYETGLDAAVDAVAFWDSYDIDFFHKEADLLLIYISDEPDQSSTSIVAYEQIMDLEKEHPFIVSEAAIVYTGDEQYITDDCGSSYTTALGTGYIDVADIVIDLCDDNWDRVLDNVKDHIPTLNERWFLSGEPLMPANDNIDVYFDNELTLDWSYDLGDNAVVLLTIPEAGTSVSIVYLMEPN